MYGITETTVHVTYRPIRRADLEKAGVSPIGVPIPDLDVLLLDANLAPVADGTVGEIFVAGPGVARGYRNRPELTARVSSCEDGRRLYRSGDLGRRNAAGDLEYLGRSDDQVKIRGFRVELGEVETVLRRQSAVQDAAVLAADGPSGEKRLVAWVVLRKAPPPATTSCGRTRPSACRSTCFPPRSSAWRPCRSPRTGRSTARPSPRPRTSARG